MKFSHTQVQGHSPERNTSTTSVMLCPCSFGIFLFSQHFLPHLTFLPISLRKQKLSEESFPRFHHHVCLQAGTVTQYPPLPLLLFPRGLVPRPEPSGSCAPPGSVGLGQPALEGPSAHPEADLTLDCLPWKLCAGLRWCG